MKKLSVTVLLMVLFSATAVAVYAGGLPVAGPRNQPPIANDDEVTLLYHPVQVVDIPVLQNDFDPEGRPLQVTGLPLIEGSKAEIVDDKAVQVTIDWSSGGGSSFGLIAHGVYLVSDGLAESKAEWFVYYWPEILP